MSRVATLTVVYAVSLPFIPRDIEIPQHYWISTYANAILIQLASVLNAPASDPAKLHKVTWLCTELVRCVVKLIKYAIIEPLIALAYLIEQFFHNYFTSVNKMAEQNVKKQEEINASFNLEVQKVANLLGGIVTIKNFAQQYCVSVLLALKDHNRLLATTTEAVQEQTASVASEMESVDTDAVEALLKKQLTLCKETLENPEALRKMRMNLTRLLSIQNAYAEAAKKRQDLRSRFSAGVETTDSLQQQQQHINAQLLEAREALAVVNRAEKPKEPSVRPVSCRSGIAYFDPLKVMRIFLSIVR